MQRKRDNGAGGFESDSVQHADHMGMHKENKNRLRYSGAMVVAVVSKNSFVFGEAASAPTHHAQALASEDVHQWFR